MTKYCAFLSLLFLLLTSPLSAAEIYDEKPVDRIAITTNQSDTLFDPSPILSRLKTKEGDPFSSLIFDQDLKALADDYDRVEPYLEIQNGQVVIHIHLIPRPIIHQIVWDGNYQFSTSTLQKELDIKPNTIFHRPQFNKAFNKVKELYFKKGYFESQLYYEVQPIEGTSQVDIRIDVQEGRPGHVQKIVLNGFTNDEESDIFEQMYLKKYNFLTHWLTGTGTYRDEIMEQDQMTILNYLHNKGYADAKVDIELIEDPETGRLIVEITAHRGTIYRFGIINVEGNSLLPNEDIEKKMTIRQGDNFSPEKLRDMVQAIKDLYGQKGYIDASVQYETYLKENEPIFDVNFSIEEGEQYKVGLIHIIGNTSTSSNVILRESLLVPGETFDSRKIKATQTKLEAMGYFKCVNVYAVRSTVEDASYRDVYIEVEETTTGSISLFVGFSSTDDIFGGIDLTERNFKIKGLSKAMSGKISALRGGGEYFHAKGTLGKKQNNILLSWMDPYFRDTLWRFGVEISRTFSELQHDAVVTTYGGSVYASYPLSAFWTAGMRQRIRHSKDHLDLDPIDPSAVAINSANQMKELLNQDGLISAFSGNLGYDSLDNFLKPHRGWRSYFETEIAGIGGNYYFFKVSYLNSIYFPVSRKGTIKLRGDFKFIVPFGKTHIDTVPYSERFFLGGDQNVRGYQPFLLGPVVELKNSEGKNVETNTPLGGISSGLVTLEYNYELFRMLDVFAFLDVGSITNDIFVLKEIRPTTGVGIRIDIGNRTPIMVGWGIPLDKKDRNDDTWQPWFFSMGGQF